MVANCGSAASASSLSFLLDTQNPPPMLLCRCVLACDRVLRPSAMYLPACLQVVDARPAPRFHGTAPEPRCDVVLAGLGRG